MHICMCVLSCVSHVHLCATLWIAGSSPWDFLGKNTGVGCHFLFQGIFLTQGQNPCILHLPALVCGFFITSTIWEAHMHIYIYIHTHTQAHTHTYMEMILNFHYAIYFLFYSILLHKMLIKTPKNDFMYSLKEYTIQCSKSNPHNIPRKQILLLSLFYRREN